MTAPDDVRARFEAWHDAKWPPPNQGEPYHWRAAWNSAKRDRLVIWQAAHADLSGEVRELVERWERNALHAGFKKPVQATYLAAADELKAALAKFTQEKP